MTIRFNNEKKEEYRFKLDILMTPDTMFDYLLYRTYHNSGIIFPYIFGIFMLYMCKSTWGAAPIYEPVGYAIVGLLFMFGIPVNCFARSRRYMTAVPGQGIEPVTYYLDDEGFYPKGEEKKILWEEVHHIVSTKKNVIIYATAKLAIFFPKDSIGEQYEDVKAFLLEVMDPRYIKMDK